MILMKSTKDSFIFINNNYAQEINYFIGRSVITNTNFS